MKVSQLILAVAVVAVSSSHVRSDVQLHSLFSNGAVLQSGMPVAVWGTAGDGEVVKVRVQNREQSTVARNGKWLVRLKPLKAGGPFEMRVTGDNQLTRNVLVGEVWIAGGQSNMELSLKYTTNAEADSAASADSQLRLFAVPHISSPWPLQKVGATWQTAGPETTPGFSAVGYYFGRALRKALNMPVGIIQSTWGGSRAELWMPREDFRKHPALAHHAEEFDKAMAQYAEELRAYHATRREYDKTVASGSKPTTAPARPKNPLVSFPMSSFYNGMIAPLIPYSMRGVIWYQGESNAGRAYEYRALFPALIESWRNAWGEGDFPFYFVQLAPFGPISPEPEDSTWAVVREAQLHTANTVPNTGMAVITDYGNPTDIHPTDKEPVGQRLALLALKGTYKKRVIASGPTYRRVRFEGNRAIVSFDNLYGGLVQKTVVLPGMSEAEKANASGSRLTGWTIAGDDRVFHKATAEIAGDTVVVSSQDVSRPVAVRYGWANTPVVNLFNKAGLPATPFRTDSFPVATQPAR
ncbi:MAG: sialate O-acetylesterase [Armatimonadetes bacterium]|nr:sialate O-acetylesterase [Armatimonadota bacterium]